MSLLPGLRVAGEYMAHHSRSFRFATLLMSGENRARIERVYAWCRHTDNLVDAPSLPDGTSVEAIDASLDLWLTQSRNAFQGSPSGIPLLDAVMQDLRDSGGSFSFPEALIRGVRSDLRFRPFETHADLRGYTHDVASVVGLWLCALHGVRDLWMLERAAALGHAMQLTNIVRDVGEDLQSGRIYIPMESLKSRGLTMVDLYGMRAGRPILAAYREAMEDLMAQADADYALAREAIPRLPSEFGRAVAAAAAIYSGIHDEVRAIGYDNFARRARTSVWKKAALAARSWWQLRASQPWPPDAGGPLGRRSRQASFNQELRPLERESLGAKVITLHHFDAETMRDAVPGVQVARLRRSERLG